ncbi:transposase [Streptosporangium sp. NPDC048865]
MLDELAAWQSAAPVVVADAGYGDNAHLRAAYGRPC